LSVGHKYKTSQPHDRGASVYGGGTEADYAELLLIEVDKKLREEPKPLTNATQYKVVHVYALNMRALPGTSARIVSTLKKGQKVTQTGPVRDHWMPVRRFLKKGWVSTRYQGKPTLEKVK
jgi:uncharacterized protein YgiM (DUF1202 family)